MKHRYLALLMTAALSVANVQGADSKTEKLKPGDTPPALLGYMRDGTRIETTQFAGKVLVVTFWASWCGPCKAELPMLEGLQNAAKGNVQVVAINIEEREQFRALVRALSSLNLKLTHDYNKVSVNAFGVGPIPHMVLIGRDGKIVNIHTGYSESSFESILGEINRTIATAPPAPALTPAAASAPAS